MDRICNFKLKYGNIFSEDAINHLIDLGYFTKPAALKYHSNYSGGLYDHSEEVTNQLLLHTEKLGLVWSRKESPYIIGILHDLCKCFNYSKDLITDKWKWNTSCPKGHGNLSVIESLKFIDLTEEEIACIRWHMGAYEGKDIFGEMGEAIKKYPNILYVQLSDMIASQIKNI